MAKGHLLPSQANTVLEIIRAYSLPPTDFEWKEEVGGQPKATAAVLVHRPTGYYFKFDIHPRNGDHVCEFSPGEEVIVNKAYPRDWISVTGYLVQWLYIVERETDAPDLWAVLSEERALVDAAMYEDDSNRPFSHLEIQKIQAQVVELHEYIVTTRSLTSEQADFVQSRLNYLAEAAKRQGRTDWLHTTIGVLFSFVISMAFSSVETRDLFRVAAQLLSFIVKGSVTLLH